MRHRNSSLDIPSPYVRTVGDSVSGQLVVDFGAGSQLAIRDLAGGQCMVIYFFQPACPACAIGARHWSGIYQLGTDGFTVPVYWISLGADPDSVRSFVNDFDIRVPIYRTLDLSAVPALGVRSVPSVWGVAGDTVRFLTSGALLTSPDSLNEHLEWCLLWREP